MAAAVAAGVQRQTATQAFACYSYWSGLPASVGELYQRRGRTAVAFPTDDNLTMVYVAAPVAELLDARRDIEGFMLRSLDACGDLGIRAREAARVERLRVAADQPNAMRVPYGPGWALVGDAGIVLDSITGQGIGNAMRDAEMLVHAVLLRQRDASLSAQVFGAYHQARDRAFRGMYDFTVAQGTFRPVAAAQRVLVETVASRPARAQRVLAAMTGALPMERYMCLPSLLTALGPAGIARAAAAQLKESHVCARAA